MQFASPSPIFGTMEGEDPATTYDSVVLALEAGYRHFDLAEHYKTQGHVGRALAFKSDDIPRDQVWLTNKIDGLPCGDYAAVRARVEAMC
jgi:diketogulonate reductase-like aldo/keto reductase